MEASFGPDVDGDGLADVVTSSLFHNSDYPELLSGPRNELLSGLDGTLLRSFKTIGLVEQHQAFPAELLGDVDGDGLGDVALGTPGSGIEWRVYEPGRVSVHSGATGRELWTVVGEHIGDGFGGKLSAGADTDRDGVGDLAVGAFWAARAEIYSGRAGDLLRELPTESSFYSYSIELGGDVNGDALADYALLDNSRDVIRVFESGTQEPLWERPLSLRAFSLRSDQDQDGAADLVTIGTDGVVSAFRGFDGKELWTYRVPGEAENYYYAVDTGPDLDRDGFGEVLVGVTRRRGDVRGHVWLLSGQTQEVLYEWSAPEDDPWFATSVSLTRDADGDGLPDVLVSSRHYGDSLGKIYAYPSCSFVD